MKYNLYSQQLRIIAEEREKIFGLERES